MFSFSRIMVLGLAGFVFTTTAASAQDPTMSLEVVSVNGIPLPKPVNEITVSPGDEMTLQIFIRDWAPNGEKLRALQAQIDDRGYTSGLTGSIHPKDYEQTTLSEFPNDKNGFIDRNDPRYIFKDVASIPVVDTISFGYRYLNILVNDSDAVVSPQDGSRSACGTLNVKVSEDASGTFLMSLKDDPGASTARDSNSVEILPLVFENLVVKVAKGTLVHRIMGSEPPSGSVDARRRADGRGWDRVDLTLNAEATGLTADMFSIVDGTKNPPRIKNLEANGTLLTLHLDRGIRAARWTSITHSASATSTTIGSLPGDVNADGSVSFADIMLLALQSRNDSTRPLYQTDVDHNGKHTVGDALRVIDLLNGSNAYRTSLRKDLFVAN
jgi:hypothetical protein